MRRLFALFLASSLTLICPANAKGPFYQFKVGNWAAGSYTSDQNGSFSHCAASASYKSGISFYVSVSVDLQWKIAFSHPNWHLQLGQSFPIDLTFDGTKTQRVFAVAQDPTFAVVPMPDNSALIQAFRSARTMSAVALGNIFAFNLDGTSRLLPALVVCVKQEGRTPVANVPNAPIVAEPVKPPVSPEVEQDRQKLLAAAADDHAKCLQTQMKDLVPYSNESAETLSQVIITKCADQEQKFVSLAVAIYGASKADVQKIVNDAIETKKKGMVAEIVTFRADVAKALANQQKPATDPADKPRTGSGI